MKRLILGIALVSACDKPTTDTPKSDPIPPPPVAGEAKSDAKANPPAMGNTGVLSEVAFKKLHEHTDADAPPPKGEMFELSGQQAYLALPEGSSGPMPGIVVIHEWWGLNVHIKHWADRLAADGYAALAVDLYGGKVATDPDGAMTLMKAVDAAQAQKILSGAHEFLANDPRINAPKRGVVGWCFGGGWSLQHALATADLDAAVIYYGRLVDDPEALSKIKAPLLGIFGKQDEGIPPASVQGSRMRPRRPGWPSRCTAMTRTMRSRIHPVPATTSKQRQMHGAKRGRSLPSTSRRGEPQLSDAMRSMVASLWRSSKS